jgi:cellulose synthase/poly-beta-1,6-N-acetylglucosamine synthase-like glycosyltransferase
MRGAVEAGGARVTLAVPCRSDEPGLGRTLAAALASWRRTGRAARGGLEILVCVNGAGPDPAVAEARAFAAAAGAPFAVADVDMSEAPLPLQSSTPLAVSVLVTRRAGKPLAWNMLRARARAPVAVFLDADVSFSPDAMGLLLDALEADPTAVLASAKTTCAPRPGAFEAIMAAPYGIDFPNLSPQLYAARLAALPRAMPEDLIEPERWLELVVRREGGRVARVPAAEVTVRLPATLADFFRQRIRIEMGKVQLAQTYAGLDAHGAPQPRLAPVLAHGPAASARLAAYLMLRSTAHAIAWWRWRRGATAGVWRQAASTKQWGPA